MEPILSICIPIYNRSGFLTRMLERFLEDKDLFESKILLKVFDNASPEDLSGIAASFRQRGLRLQYIRQETNIGPDRNICACFRAGEGRYTWVLGSDDIPLPGFLRRVISSLEAGSYGLVHFCHYAEKTSGAMLYTDPERFFMDMHVWITFISANIVATRFIAGASLEAYAQTSLSQVPLYLEAGFRSPENLVLYGSWQEAATDALSNGGYNFFEVFTENLLTLVHRPVETGVMSGKSYARIKRRIFRDFLAENIINFLILRRISGFDTRSGWKTTLRHYGKKPYFYGDLAAKIVSLTLHKAGL